jgi:myo-inositol 2-dehydrogenase/D-chiro-inositol 1-dehydrogenase
MSNPSPSRRDFLHTGAAAGAALTASAVLPGGVFAAGSDEIRVGIIGCGGRGQGAGENVLQSARGVKIVALGDYFEEDPEKRRGVEPARRRFMGFAARNGKVKDLGNSVDIPKERCFTGLDAYKKVLEQDINYVILATSPGFRPIHLDAAVKAGKTIFTEKPVAVDGTGIRSVLATYGKAKGKGLAIGAGTQRRHQAPYLETMKRVHGGEIGDIVAANCYWNGGFIWFRARRDDMTDLDYQIHNWYHFLWLCGDHIVEQHVHNLDVVNWATGKLPVAAVGVGGRVRPYRDPQIDGDIFNFFSIDFEYPDGVHVHSMARQINNCDKNISEYLMGTKGNCQPNAYRINGKPVVGRAEARAATNPYVQEHTDLIACVRAGKPYNELENVAHSTLTAILGRMAAYTGKRVTWEDALNTTQDTMPKALARDSKIDVAPLPVPGKTALPATIRAGA